MTTQTLKSNLIAWPANPSHARRVVDATARPAVDATRGSIRSGPVMPGAADPERAPTASRRRLEAAQREVARLRAESSVLNHQVTLLSQALERARQHAHHDDLTGLPNRRLLLERYNQAIALAERQHRQVALLLLDLDDFKSINDAHGHAAGDRVLQQVAARLRDCIRSSDTACRYGGDEFVVLLPEFEGRESAAAAAEKISTRLSAPFDIDGTAVRVRASIGIAVYPVDGHEYIDLLQATDRAMYRNKVRGAARPDGQGARRSS